MERKTLSVLTPCYNESENIGALYRQIKDVFASLPDYDYEHIFIDNCSTDDSVEQIRTLAATDKNVRAICNARNFGHIRSPFYGMLQCGGAAVILMASDLQDPPALIRDFVKKWEAGAKIVIGVKDKSEENPLMFAIRKIYYKLVRMISDVDLVTNFTGFGLYDREFIAVLRKLDVSYPYLRGLVAELGGQWSEVSFVQPKRRRGRTKNNFLTLYDMAMTGVVSHSKLPLRLAGIVGFILATLSLGVAISYTIYKLLHWDEFQLGQAPIVIGLFFFAAVQLFFIGILGEYIGAIFTHVNKRPLVVERERINFD
ncbi:MAG: glycosyltransferase family 2 protein [Halieaceae bacterium]|jgi:polyisoprenyl-phosphate glycosyltransferase|nr:glycosyltransferase family 2 protein [Halieaceae bacterium]